MNEDFREWYLTVCPAPVEGQIAKRIGCIKSYAEEVDATEIISLVKMYYGINDSEDFITSFATHFSKEDESFSHKYSEELILLAGAVLVEIAKNNTGGENSLVELLSVVFDKFRTPKATQSIASAIKNQFNKDRISLREEQEQEQEQEELDITAFKTLVEAGSLNATAITSLVEILESFQESIENIDSWLSVSKTSQSIYKEDSQILWWMSSEWSNYLKRSLKDIDITEACLIVGKEAADFITNFPGPYSMEGVLNKILDFCKGKTDEIEFLDLISKIDADWKEQYIRKIKDSPIAELLPLSTALIRSNGAVNPEEWHPKFTREVMSKEDYIPLTLKEYAWQMYLEVMAFNCFSKLENV